MQPQPLYHMNDDWCHIHHTFKVHCRHRHHFDWASLVLWFFIVFILGLIYLKMA